MKIVKKIVRKIYDYFILFKLWLLAKFYNKKIFVLGTPVHGNLGDQAIALGEVHFLKLNFSGYHIIEIESGIVFKYSKFLKKLIKSSLILVHGGGFLGTLWPREEKMFRVLLEKFNDNTIIVFPQTIYFSNDDFGSIFLEESKKAYSSHKKLYFCCREQYSYDYMKKEFNDCNIFLVPDMVLYLKGIESDSGKNGALFCVRNDHEKVDYNYNEITAVLQKRDMNIDYTDTVIKKRMFKFNRQKHVLNKIRQFGKYKLVVTDRLHGMVFAFLAKTPCLVYENTSYKVKGVYKWLSNFNYIRLYDKINIQNDINELLNDNFEYAESVDLPEYQVLIDLIKDNLE